VHAKKFRVAQMPGKKRSRAGILLVYFGFCV
jgi:hypothetical protein